MKRNLLTTARLPVMLVMMALFTGLSCSRQARVVWQRRFEVGTVDFGSSVATDGRDIVVGTTCRDTSGGTQRTAWQFLRYDHEGNLQWHRTCERGKSDSLADVALTADHDIVAVGCTGTNTAADPVRLLLARFSAQGDMKWRKEYQFGSGTRGVVVRLDTIGRIWVCGSVSAGGTKTGNMLVARFDSLGNLLDTASVAGETGEDLLLVPSRVGDLGIFAAGLKCPSPDKSVKTRNVVVVRLDPDLHEIQRWVCDSSRDDVSARLSWEEFGVCAAVTSREDSGVVTHVVEFSTGSYYLPTNQETRYPGAPNARCNGLVVDRAGALLGVGAYGPSGQQRYLSWRCFQGKFTDFLSGSKYSAGANDRASALALDADGNLVVSGVSESGGRVDLLTIKMALPHHKPPPDIWLPNMYR